jgi:hypothetical protein
MNAAVAAVRAVLGQDEQVRSTSGEARPWVTIRLVNQVAAPAVTTIEHKPLEVESDDPNDPAVERLREPRFHDIDR